MAFGLFRKRQPEPAAITSAPAPVAEVAPVAATDSAKEILELLELELSAMIRQLEKAAKTEPNNLRVRWYRGQLLKRLGRTRDALLDFKFIVERDPRHTDAHREVRLYAMRRGNRPPSDPPHTPSHPAGPDSQGGRKSSPPKPGGLLNKLFTKP